MSAKHHWTADYWLLQRHIVLSPSHRGVFKDKLSPKCSLDIGDKKFCFRQKLKIGIKRIA